MQTITANTLANMEIKTILGENLKRYRKEKHLSQEQLSEKINISVKHLSSIERGLTFVSAELLENLSKILEVPIYLFFLKESEIVPNDLLLEKIDRTVEKYLIKSIENIKTEIRQTN